MDESVCHFYLEPRLARPRNFSTSRPQKAAALATAFLLCIWSHDGARAQANLAERELKASPGRDVRVGVFTSIRPDCTSGPLPAIRLATAPAHGSVNVKRGMLKATNFKQCLATEVPAFVAFYRAAPDFEGSDAFDLEITFVDGRKQIQHIRMNVTKGSSGAQGI